MFLEQLLSSLRDGQPEHLAEFREEHERIQAGIRFLMQREFGSALGEANASALGEALYAFYWGARLLKLIEPNSSPPAQLAEVQKMMDAALRGGRSQGTN